jgi:hypothetical protein
MKQFKKIVAANGKYTDSAGQEKTRYITVGKAFLRDDNSVTLKIDSMPVGGEWNGWLSLYDLDEGRQGGQSAPSAPAPSVAETDLPF